ncbi:MAG: hypothetical protein EOP53_19100, partial [Sphingobacteriales bacterium]
MQQQPVSNIKALSILHFSLLIGQIVFAAIAYYLHSSGTMAVIELGEDEKYVLLGVAALGLLLVGLALSVYKKKIATIKDTAQPVKEKMMAYRAASLIRWAMLEAPVLVAIIAFLLTGNYNFLIIAGAILLLFLSTKPSASKVAAE